MTGNPAPGARRTFVSAVLLAAGASTRFGSPKLLAEIDGEPILRRITKAFCFGGADELLVVLPPDEGTGLQALLRRVIEDLPSTVRWIENPKWRDGMFTSVKAGLAAAAAGGRSTHVAVSPADLPFLSTESIRRILSAAASLEERRLLVPTCSGRRGHPLVFPASLGPRLLSWPDDRRLSDLFREADLSILPLDGFGDDVLHDVDAPSDLAAAGA